MSDGWIKLHRKLLDNPMWTSEPFTRGQAWVDLLLLANHESGWIRKRGILIEVKRGQVGHSEELLSARWRWSRGKLRRFLNELKSVQQIEREAVQQNINLSSLISIVNYDLYQQNDTTNNTTDETIDRTTNGQQTDNKRYRNKKNKKKEEEKEIKNIYSECVLLTEKEYEKLSTKFSKPLTDKAIEILNNAIQSKGYKYKSHYHTLLGWPMERAKENTTPGQPINQKKPEETFVKCPNPSCGKEVAKQFIQNGHCYHCEEHGEIPDFKTLYKEIGGE